MNLNFITQMAAGNLGLPGQRYLA